MMISCPLSYHADITVIMSILQKTFNDKGASMNKQKNKCVNCDYAMYRASKDCDIENSKQGYLCLYCTKHRKVIGERFVCDDWIKVRGNI